MAITRQAVVHFILVPDKSAARRLRRMAATASARVGVQVGTWPELVSLAQKSYLLPSSPDEWRSRLDSALESLSDSFWSKSLHHVPSDRQQIADAVERTLVTLLEGAGPVGRLDAVNPAVLPPRSAKHLADLARLRNALGNLLPPHLAVIRQILDASTERLLRPARVYHREGWPVLNPWQRALVEKLNRDAGACEDPELAAYLAEEPAAAPAGTALGHLQRHLFAMPDSKPGRDATLQWLAVRDCLQEVEVAAGMVQQSLAEDPSLAMSDLALLLPADERYDTAVRTVFTMAGIPVSGLASEATGRDLGREAVFNLLLSLDKPAPVIALAALLTSPLMPWDCAAGNRLAQEVINHKFALEAGADSTDDACAMLEIIRNKVQSCDEVRERLKRFVQLSGAGARRLTDEERSSPLFAHRMELEQCCAALIESLDGKSGEIPWNELRKTATPRNIPVHCGKDLNREGVAVFHEGEEPWRRVRRLFVLGCHDGHYPPKTAGFSLFTDQELELFRTVAGLELVTAAEQNRQQRQLFLRQLRSASDHATFLVPRRDPLGKSLSPSAAITFSAALFSDVRDEDELVLELDSASDRARAFGLPPAPRMDQQAPRSPDPQDLKFDRNLLELNKGTDGSMKPESPSRLEKLMISPLAWLFERLGVEPRDWQPETLDIRAKGTLAHAVFELLFDPKVPLPERDRIEAQVPALLKSKIAEIMPFLHRREWKVERKHLQQEIVKAALQWREILFHAGARPVAVEISLKGELHGVPIHGNADLLLELPPNRLYVVDYKKSSSNDRRKRMEAGYDHQAELYRTMIRTGGLEKPEKAPAGLAEKLAGIRDTGEIGTLYYLMNDQTALADSAGWLPVSIGNLEEMQNSTSGNAMKLIQERFAQLRRGCIELNTTTDEKEFKDKRGISAYALKGSPLVGMWMINANIDRRLKCSE